MNKDKPLDESSLDAQLNEFDQKVTPGYLLKLHKVKLAQRIKAGETGLFDEFTKLKELEKLVSPEAEPPASSPQPASPDSAPGEAGASYDPEAGDDPDPEKRRVMEKFAVRPRKYHMSEAALSQRKKAAQSPAKSEAMIGNTNAWKTGENARSFVARVFRPCLSSCPQYPCELIAEGETAPGSVCLDKKEFVKGLVAVQKAMREGKLDDLKDIMSLRIAGNLDILGMLQQDIIENGVNCLSEKIDKDGKVIGHELKPRPSLLVLPKLTEVTGATPMNQMIDPREIKRQKTESKKAKTLAGIMSGIGLGGDEKEQRPEEGDDE
ncbi:MAG: hypothetical protein OEW15_17565 [Nitrospirota bacterium]|nr:hypothetical protein [Nitrospirota bacterium]